jgi:LysR family transcriptional activator of nhaA
MGRRCCCRPRTWPRAGRWIEWFDQEGIWPEVKAEIEDSALLKTFGSAGLGLFLAPAMTREAICRQYGVVCLGSLPTVHERFT